MYKKILLLSIPFYITFFSACSNKEPEQNNSNKQVKKQNSTINETSIVGKIVVGALAFYATKGNIGKTMKATKFGGTASGYFVGRKLSNMQKRYKEKEEQLIADIIKIEEESIELKEKNSNLSSDLSLMEEKITKLKTDKTLRVSEKKVEKEALRSKLEKQKKKLQALLLKNKKISDKISYSKGKANEYNYKKEDKKEIIKSVNMLKKSSEKFATNINININSIDEILKTL